MNAVWVNPDNTSIQLLAIQLRQRLQDIFLQNLDTELENSSKCVLYKHLVSDNRQWPFYLSKLAKSSNWSPRTFNFLAKVSKLLK